MNAEAEAALKRLDDTSARSWFWLSLSVLIAAHFAVPRNAQAACEEAQAEYERKAAECQKWSDISTGSGTSGGFFGSLKGMLASVASGLGTGAIAHNQCRIRDEKKHNLDVCLDEAARAEAARLQEELRTRDVEAVRACGEKLDKQKLAYVVEQQTQLSAQLEDLRAEHILRVDAIKTSTEHELQQMAERLALAAGTLAMHSETLRTVRLALERERARAVANLSAELRRTLIDVRRKHEDACTEASEEQWQSLVTELALTDDQKERCSVHRSLRCSEREYMPSGMLHFE